jgi:hypothetical protein
LKTQSPRKNAGRGKSLPSSMFQISGDLEAVGFPAPTAYKMAHGGDNATFEPLNP